MTSTELSQKTQETGFAPSRALPMFANPGEIRQRPIETIDSWEPPKLHVPKAVDEEESLPGAETELTLDSGPAIDIEAMREEINLAHEQELTRLGQTHEEELR